VIHLTPRALSRLSELRAKMPGMGDVRLRVRVDGGGCSGYKYEFQVGSEPLEEGDKVFGEGGCFAVVDPVSLDLLNGSLVDWEESLMRSAFVIAANPNAEASCGCKSSFSVKGGGGTT
jgi:iron-sulfur cluster assembly accessory protein